jgi:hypothetical protein
MRVVVHLQIDFALEKHKHTHIHHPIQKSTRTCQDLRGGQKVREKEATTGSVEVGRRHAAGGVADGRGAAARCALAFRWDPVAVVLRGRRHRWLCGSPTPPAEEEEKPLAERQEGHCGSGELRTGALLV